MAVNDSSPTRSPVTHGEPSRSSRSSNPGGAEDDEYYMSWGSVDGGTVYDSEDEGWMTAQSSGEWQVRGRERNPDGTRSRRSRPSFNLSSSSNFSRRVPGVRDDSTSASSGYSVEGNRLTGQLEQADGTGVFGHHLVQSLSTGPYLSGEARSCGEASDDADDQMLDEETIDAETVGSLVPKQPEEGTAIPEEPKTLSTNPTINLSASNNNDDRYNIAIALLRTQYGEPSETNPDGQQATSKEQLEQLLGLALHEISPLERMLSIRNEAISAAEHMVLARVFKEKLPTPVFMRLKRAARDGIYTDMILSALDDPSNPWW